MGRRFASQVSGCCRKLLVLWWMLVNFMHREGSSVHCLSADAKTLLSPRLEMTKESTMLRFLRARWRNG
jgi:hypothetical protein